MDIKPAVGMTVYLRPTAYNHNKDIREGTLTKIGRKYYTVAAPHQEFKFGISCLRMISDYSPDYTLFFSKEQLDSEVERERLLQKLELIFESSMRSNCQLTYEQVRNIAGIAGVIPLCEHSDSDDGQDGDRDRDADTFEFNRLRSHVGHHIEVALYGGNWNVSVECMDCYEVLYSVENPNNGY